MRQPWLLSGAQRAPYEGTNAGSSYLGRLTVHGDESFVDSRHASVGRENRLPLAGLVNDL